MPTTPEGRSTPPELALLFCCARLHLDPRSEARIDRLLWEEIDWKRFLTLADRHRLLPLVWQHLRGRPREAMPEEVADALDEAFIENAGHALRVAGELLSLLERFRSRGLLAIPYKGPALAARLYGDLALRQTGDLDILVRPADTSAARELLQAEGYRPRLSLTPAAERFQTRGRKSETFERAGSAVVELHWAFTDDFFPFALEMGGLAARLDSVVIGATPVPVFANEDLLLILSVHGWKHCWERLEWICGVAELVRTPSMAWDPVLVRARTLGVHSMLLLALRLAHDLLGAPLPPHLLRELGREPRLARRVDEVLQLLAAAEGRDWRLAKRDLFRYRLLGSVGARLRFLSFRVTTPEPTGWVLLRLGPYILPLHRLFWPLRRVAKVGGRTVRRAISRSDHTIRCS